MRSFRRDETLCPLGSSEIGEKITTKDCLAIVEELKRQIYEDSRTLDNFKKQSQQFLGMFSAHNTFHFNVSPVTEEEFIAFASNLCEFVENDKSRNIRSASVEDIPISSSESPRKWAI